MENDMLTQTYDGPGSDPSIAIFVGFEEVSAHSGQFLIISCVASGRQFLGQIASPQLNLNRDALGPLDNTTLNQLQAMSTGRIARGVAVREAFYYKVRLLKDISDGMPRSVRVRPQIVASARNATEEEVVRFIGLPEVDERTQLGSIIDTDVAVCLDRRVLMHHFLVAGSTGSGKTNTIANIARASTNMEMCTIIYDHKPDYQNVHEPNEGTEPWYEGMPDVDYWYLGGALGTESEKAISVPASELDPAVLAATVCCGFGEQNSMETLETLLWTFAEQHGDGRQWTISDFRRFLPRDHGDLPIKVDKKTYDAMERRLDRRGRIPGWIDGPAATVASSFFGRPEFNLEDIIRPGRIIVIRVDSSAGGGRGYGLFLSYILKEVYRLRERGRCPCPVLHVIDEAQDIFNAGRSFQIAVGGMLDENIRKGRSRKIGFVIGVQSADAVPEDIRNNLNSQLIHRHNNHSQAREAMTRATPEQLAMTDTFGPGECLSFIFGSNAVMHCQMRQSPFKLTKDPE